MGVVTAYVPMACDRYFLALQAPTSLLAAGGLVWAFAAASGLWGGRERGGVA